MSGPWEILSDESILRHPYMWLDLITARGRDGAEFSCLRGGGPELVYSVPVWDDGDVTLIRIRRFGIDDPSLEVPGGHVDDGEQPAAAALRELAEETGVRAARSTPLFSTLLSLKVQQRMHFYVAQQLQQGESSPDAGEDIEVVRIPFAQALDHATSGTIVHGPSVTALLATARHLAV